MSDEHVLCSDRAEGILSRHRRLFGDCHEKALPRPAQFRSALLNEACVAAGITLAEVRGPDRRAKTTRGRFHVMYILRKRGWTLNQIAQAVHRDHTSVLHGIKKFQKLLDDHEVAQ